MAAASGPQFAGDRFVGAGTPLLRGGYLFRFKLTGNRRKVAVDDPRLEDRVADNLAKHEITELRGGRLQVSGSGYWGHVRSGETAPGP